MTVKDLQADLAAIPDHLPVRYFDGSQAWDIEIVLAQHRTGDEVWITRKPRTEEQALFEACLSVRAFLKTLELGTEPRDPLRDIQRRVHGPLLEELESAIGQYRRANEAR